MLCIHYPGGFCCVQLVRTGGEEQHNTTANHLKDPLILFQHMMTLFAHLSNCLQKVGQLQLQFSRLENDIPQQTVHPGQLAKVHAEMQHTTKGLLERMAVLEKLHGGTQVQLLLIEGSSLVPGRVGTRLRPREAAHFHHQFYLLKYI